MRLHDIIPQLHALLKTEKEEQINRILRSIDCLYQASYAGFALHPFDINLTEDDLLQVNEDLTFQLRWSLLLIEQISTLTTDEVEAVGPLKPPYTPDWISAYMEQIKSKKENRSLLNRLKRNAPLSQDLLRIQTRSMHLKKRDEPLICGSKKLTHQLRYISTGHFWMGADDNDGDAFPQERPRHPVVIPMPFWMATVPVTQELYTAVMKKNPSRYQTPLCPVDNVRWIDAIVFCNRLSRLEGLTPLYPIDEGTEKALLSIKSTDSDVLTTFLNSKPLAQANGYRLPTEAEWEYAARAKQSDASDDQSLKVSAWYHDNSAQQSHPCAQKEPNAFGLYDMRGNVWEWCWNSWDNEPYPETAELLTISQVQQDNGINRICRGGSWYDSAQNCRVTNRQASNILNIDPGQGFRIVRNIIH